MSASLPQASIILEQTRDILRELTMEGVEFHETVRKGKIKSMLYPTGLSIRKYDKEGNIVIST